MRTTLENVILISIKPEHAVNILNGKKKLELRKTAPKDFEGYVYIYVTKSGCNLINSGRSYQLEIGNRLDYDLNGKVVARFYLNKTEEVFLNEELEIETEDLSHNTLLKRSYVNYDQLNNYFSNENGDVNGYVWYIRGLEILDKPKLINGFFNNDKKWSNHYLSWIRIKDEIINKHRLKNPPQSWQYVWVETNE